MSGALGHRQFDERNEELERLCKLVRDLELEARGRRQRRDRDDREEGFASGGGHYGPSLISPVPVDTWTVHVHRSM